MRLIGRFLDLRTSQNASYADSIAVAVGTTPVLFGVIGLQTASVANPVVGLNGVLAFTPSTGLVGTGTVNIQVVRGSTTFGGGPVVFSAAQGISGPGILGVTELLSFEAADLLAPAAPETIYSAFVSGSAAGIATRVGPESFWGLAQNGAVPPSG